ncbi:helix-turn-helix transcriptional regulator [Methylobacterium oxalidis]|uniref:Transcriptional regulator n=1 Tax=Methylobacterium oxalidis TaxID=944322 RepID=A0A512JDR4_9HYPH|nr:helix-turn-helix transcriptional regulator [Methylobacterium oxalidis]GEP08058.1 transcriptional regulator [Methylobacterium oxalidis]GLS65782.1 transcriptional regulator [Methylobacterium oxalidis]
MVISRAQCRAARALLEWTQDRLSAEASVSKKTLVDFEAGKRTPYDRTIADIVRALETAGIEFISENGGGVGVRFRHKKCADNEN